MIGQIVSGTPPWVWLVLAYLIYQGIQALRTRTQPVWRALIVPGVFIVSGLSRIVLARGNAAAPLIA